MDKKKFVKTHRGIQVRVDVFDLFKDLVVREKVNMAGLMAYLGGEIMKGSLELDWDEIRRLHPEARRLPRIRWEAMEKRLTEGLTGGKVKDVPGLVKFGDQNGYSKKQVLKALENMEEVRCVTRNGRGILSVNPEKMKHFNQLDKRRKGVL